MSTTADDEVRYEVPKTVAEARSLLADAPFNKKIAAGGQSLVLLLRQGLLDPELIVDISSVPEYGRITEQDEAVTIGSAVTYTQLGNHAVSTNYPLLSDAISVIADPQVRNRGTIGGAIGHADPALDILPPLLSLEASVSVGGPGGERTVPLAEFCEGYMMTDLGPDELIEGIVVPRADWSGSAYTKFSNVKGGWATVGVSATVSLDEDGDRIDEANVALAAVADTPVRAPTVEAKLVGNAVSEGAIGRAADAVDADIDPLDDVSGSAQYKRRLARTLVRRTMRTAVERAGGVSK